MSRRLSARETALSLMAVALSLVALTVTAHGQSQPQTVPPGGLLFALQSAPQPTASASVSRIGNPGQRNQYYWVVSNSLIGQSSPAGPFTLNQGPSQYGRNRRNLGAILGHRRQRHGGMFRHGGYCNRTRRRPDSRRSRSLADGSLSFQL